jgi:putative peptidoglycan lipid II flippase
MFLKAGALSLALLVASRLLGLARESAQAAAFGASGMGDVVVLMLTFPDWLTGVLASGALAYVLLPAWARQTETGVAASQRRVARVLLVAGAAAAVLLALSREPALHLLASGLPPSLQRHGALALVWSAIALPAALLAALWTTRLQHERDFVGMYGANLVVNTALIASLAAAAVARDISTQLFVLGLGLLAAMLLRLGWLHHRAPPQASHAQPTAGEAELPRIPVWLLAVLVAGLPLALPFTARSLASQSGEGALAIFNYAWKLVELPLALAIQLVSTLAFPAVARAFASSGARPDAAVAPVRNAFAWAWALACAAAAALVVGAPALGQLLFGWGRMDSEGITRIAHWGSIAAWGLLPQAVIAVATIVLASQRRLRPALAAYSLALAVLLLAGANGVVDGASLMAVLNAVLCGVALVLLAALGPQVRHWLPWRAMATSFAGLVALAPLGTSQWARSASTGGGLGLALLFAAVVLTLTWLASAELRAPQTR